MTPADGRSSIGRRRTAIALCLLVSVAALAACEQVGHVFPLRAGGSPPQSHGGPVRDHVSFVDALRAAGYTVDPVGQVRQPFLRAAGTVLRIGGGGLRGSAEVQSYNYDDRDLGTDGFAAARADADRIQPDGQPSTGRVAWTAPPHFFRKERLLVIYVGADPAVVRLLAVMLGPQFAGQ
jgi:hypothetical protein